jgi:hypothetical protein
LWADRNAIPCERACHSRREDEVLGAFVDRSGVMRFRIGHARDHGRVGRYPRSASITNCATQRCRASPNWRVGRADMRSTIRALHRAAALNKKCSGAPTNFALAASCLVRQTQRIGRKSKARADRHAVTAHALSVEAIAGARNRAALSSMPECEALSLARESSDHLAARRNMLARSSLSLIGAAIAVRLRPRAFCKSRTHTCSGRSAGWRPRKPPTRQDR